MCRPPTQISIPKASFRCPFTAVRTVHARWSALGALKLFFVLFLNFNFFK